MTNKSIIDKYYIDSNNTFVLVELSNLEDEQCFKIILPLHFKDYDFNRVDEWISLLSQEFKGYNQMSKNINLIVKYCYKYLDKYIDNSGNLTNIINSDLIDGENDKDDNIDELLRVFVKSLKINNMEICSNCGDYFLLYKKKIYNYDKDKMKLNLSNIENLNECKHLYGSRLFDFNKNDFYDVDTKNFTSLIPCADSDDDMNNLNDTETENKISALKKLCGILKNMNETETARDNQPRKFDKSPFLKSTTQSNDDKKRGKKYKDDSSDSEDINVESLREKIKNLNSKKNKKSFHVSSDCDSPDYDDCKDEPKKQEEPTQLQQLILYFLTNPDSLPKLIDTVNNTIDSFTDNLNPTKLLGRNRPLRIQKYFSNVNLVLKYIEMLKIIELKYKQTLEFRCNCDDFDLNDEAIYFNDHLNKIWDMVKLIICELSALRLNNITCTTPQCEDIQFRSSDLFVKDNKNYKKILEKIGFATDAQNNLDTTKIKLDPTCTKILLINTISQHQRIIVNAFRKYMNSPYNNLESEIKNASAESDVNKAVWEKIFNALDLQIPIAEIKAAKSYDATNKYDVGQPSANPAKHTAMQELDAALTAVSAFDITKFINNLVEVVDKAFDLLNTKLSKTAGGATHYALGVNYGTNFDEVATTIKSDGLVGSLYVLKKSGISSTMNKLIEKTIKKLLVEGKRQANIFNQGANSVILNDIKALASKCELSEEYLPSCINILQYVDATGLVTINLDQDGDGKVIASEYENALKNIYDNTKSKYDEILKISYSSQNEFINEMTDKASKDVIIQRRKKLINFLKQLENDTNLSLSFFGEMATSYNTTTDSKALNAPPDVFLNIFKQHQHQHQQQHQQQHYHHQHPHSHNFNGHRAPTNNEPQQTQQTQQQPQEQYQEPASARTASSNDILNDSDENYDSTTDDESDNGFKLKESPKQNTNSFRKTYTGSKKNYN